MGILEQPPAPRKMRRFGYLTIASAALAATIHRAASEMTSSNRRKPKSSMHSGGIRLDDDVAGNHVARNEGAVGAVIAVSF